MSKYGAWGEKNMYGKITLGVIRSTVLIDPKGKVVKHWKRVKAIRTCGDGPRNPAQGAENLTAKLRGNANAYL
jgi:peroxiredoxin Q/BCP|tara:strand:+ start:260 stop:478 length:219 start_codon:yes stop_codon:yes gene_type:complete